MVVKSKLSLCLPAPLRLISSNSRIRSLENQVTSMQSTLTELVKTLRQGMSSSTSQGSGATPTAISNTSDYGQQLANMSGINMNILGSSPTNNFDMQYHTNAGASGSTPPFLNTSNPPGGFMGQTDPSGMLRTQGSMSWPNQMDQTANQSLHGPYGGVQIDPSLLGVTSETSRRQPPQGPAHSVAWPQSLPQTHSSQSQETAAKKALHMSLPPSRTGSETPDDILAPEEIINPLGAMSNMAGLVEAAVKRAKDDATPPSALSAVGGAGMDEGADGESRLAKRRRTSPIVPHGPVVFEAQNLPPQSTKEKTKRAGKKSHIHAYPDAVAEGFVTEEEGRELMGM